MSDTHELQPTFDRLAEFVFANCSDPEKAKAIIRMVLRAMDRSEQGLWTPHAVIVACGLTALITGLICVATFM
jgi:hypothetical protein